jgi:hypothetical protein
MKHLDYISYGDCSLQIERDVKPGKDEFIFTLYSEEDNTEIKSIKMSIEDIKKNFKTFNK